MKSSDAIYSSPAVRKTRHAGRFADWLRSRERPQKENTSDHFLTNLRRTRPEQIGPDLEDIDQGNQQFLLVNRRATEANRVLTARLAELTKELERLENLHMARSRQKRLLSPMLSHRVSGGALVKNLERGIWTATLQLARRTAQAAQLRTNEAVLEYERVASELAGFRREAEAIGSIQAKLQVKEHRRRQTAMQILSKTAERKYEKALKLEQKLEEIGSIAVPQEEPEDETTTELLQELDTHQARNKDLADKISALEDEIKSLRVVRDACAPKPGPALSVHVQSFFMYVLFYLASHDLSPDFFLDFLTEGAALGWQGTQHLFDTYFGIPPSSQRTEMYASLSREFAGFDARSLFRLYLRFKGENEGASDPVEPGPTLPKTDNFVDWIHSNLSSGLAPRRLTCMIQHPEFSKESFDDIGHVVLKRSNFAKQVTAGSRDELMDHSMTVSRLSNAQPPTPPPEQTVPDNPRISSSF